MQKPIMWLATLAGLTGVASAQAETYRVGPGGDFRELAELPALEPGDRVEVEGGATYAAHWFQDSGTAAEPIVIHGVRSATGERPRIEGGNNTVELMGDHLVFEGFDVSGGSSRCVYHHGDDVVVRDCVIHDCPAQGLLGADGDSGSLLLEYTEIHHCGEGDGRHQVYMSTDQLAHPGAVFRMQYCWVHDGNGGNGVKSRAERNEIYYNWIEGSYYHDLELIGPDPGGTDVAEDAHREDSDVVGNVFVKNGSHPTHWVVRFGGDATGQSNGRYRFVNNTVVLAPESAGVFRLFDGILSLEASNNVIFQTGSGDAQVVRDAEAAWVDGTRRVSGANNWVVTGTGLRDLPTDEWTGTLGGTDPGFGSLDDRDLRPTEQSPLVDAGAEELPGFDFPEPELVPLYQPPDGVLLEPGTAQARPAVGAIDIGAYEFGSGPPVAPPATGGASAGGAPSYGGADDATGGSGAPTTGGTNAAGEASHPADDGDADDDGGCGCRLPNGEARSHAPHALALLLGWLALRRRSVTRRARAPAQREPARGTSSGQPGKG
ncbi:MAG TPA: right-handed parallel beta-helix repeat-containing protein [Polyangiaceae bacterium]|nr:right-handed parallel beta-helix repeat-containing protein [Polyangiaceae bacterium]